MNPRPTPSSLPPSALPPPRRRPWKAWVLVSVFLVVPTLLLIGVMSCFGLGSDAAALRQSVVTSARPSWNRQIELRLGSISLALARQALRFVDLEPEARQMLEAVRGVEVGVYERREGASEPDPAQLLKSGDDALGRRGWERVVGVVHDDTLVNVYGRSADSGDGNLRLCILVRHQNRLVVASVRGRADSLMKLVQEHAGPALRGFRLGSGD